MMLQSEDNDTKDNSPNQTMSVFGRSAFKDVYESWDKVSNHAHYMGVKNTYRVKPLDVPVLPIPSVLNVIKCKKGNQVDHVPKDAPKGLRSRKAIRKQRRN